MPDRITRRIKGGEVVATIAMPALYSLEMSGATKLYCEDFFDTGNRPFKIELSGAARVTRIDLSGSELDMELGGAANIRLTGAFDKAYIDAGGASRCDLDMDARIISEELSGASKAYHTGKYGEIKVDASGASVFSVKGSAESLKILEKGGVVCVFPESRLPRPGEKRPLPFASSVAYLALTSGAPVIPVYTNGSHFKKERVRVMIGTPIDSA